MMAYLGVALVVAGAVMLARVAARAVSEEYLLVLRWREHGLWIFERDDEDGRYARIPLGAVPVALLRFAWRTYYPRPVPVRLRGGTPATDAA
jgi:hypothetical protein